MSTPDAGGATPDASDSHVTDAGQTPGPDAAMSIACGPATCSPGQRCANTSDGTKCVDVACSELTCKASERCDPHPQGGHVCANSSCSGDVECQADWFCGGGSCKPDVCSAGARSCDADKVNECSANGGEVAMQFVCQSAGHFDSKCSEASGIATCSCLDDWNCPANTVCETGACMGTGRAPTCSLPSVAFSDSPPDVELLWGGASPEDNAAHDGTAARTLAPWSNFSQVVNTPIVANLDDDNGDGLVNELDFPEILFASHQGNNHWTNGVVRAIHGGGPRKGADYFSICGARLWTEGMPLPAACADNEPDADPGAPLAVGDLNGDGFPEIVYTTETDVFRILDHTGALLYELKQPYALASDGGNGPSIANLDFTGYPEIVLGNVIYVLGEAPGGGILVTHILTGTASKGTNEGSTMNCVADLLPDEPGLEFVAGATLYKLPQTLPSCASAPCAGSLDIVWNATLVAGNAGRLSGEGFCAVADVWGADLAQAPGPKNRPDGKPEVILIDNGDLTILEGQTGKIIQDGYLGGGIYRGGAPNVDDFDGDGFMEVASALETYYIVADLQPSTGNAGSCPDWPNAIARNDQAGGAHNPNPARMPGGSCTADSECDPAAVCNKVIGKCVCQHNGWRRRSDDSSSAATSSSVFDFNGDGAAEVLYNDECDFRVYDGTSGEVLYSQTSRTRTGTENPVVADVDNDGNAEVLTTLNTAVDRCDDDLIDPTRPQDPASYKPVGANGLRVWGDPSDNWAAARRIWNQQSYHVTNVTESGAIPVHEPESWKAWQGRLYNTYRSQPRSFGAAPDLTVAGLGISSPDARCGSLSDNIDIAFEIANVGDLRVGPGVVVRFFGTWDGAEQALKGMNGEALEVVLAQSLEPGKSTIQKVNFARSYNAKTILPSAVRVVVDPQSQQHPGASGAERECREDNNDKRAVVETGSLRADLSLELSAVTLACPNTKVETKVRNIGSAEARNVVVRYYAGDPEQGGMPLHDETLSGPVAAGGEVTLTATVPLQLGRNITIHAAVDPDKKVEECNEANNADADDKKVYCEFSPQ